MQFNIINQTLFWKGVLLLCREFIPRIHVPTDRVITSMATNTFNNGDINNVINLQIYLGSAQAGKSVRFWFGLVWFYDISTIVGYLMPNPFYTYILNI